MATIFIYILATTFALNTVFNDPVENGSPA